MTGAENLEDRALADRLVNYSDAIVALAFIISSGLGLAIVESDSRSTITSVSDGMTIGNIILGVMFSALLIVLRRWELDLRSGAGFSRKGHRYSRYIYIARHSVVWFTILQTVITMQSI